MLECIIYYVVDNTPISKYQWGLCTTDLPPALISVTHDWLCSPDSGKEICVDFFDIKKILDLDSVPHIPLLQKLSDVGLLIKREQL